jgi:HD-like signal output (HDOD) protein
MKVQALVGSEKSNAAGLASIIRQDPALATKVLKVANSAYFGSVNRRITSVEQAVARIGFNEVRNISVAMSLIKHFSKKSNQLDYKQFWRHSLTAAFLTQSVVRMSSVDIFTEERECLFLSGLFHDIGILIYDQFFAGEFAKITDEALQKEISFLAAEQKIAAKESHPIIGSALLEIWKIEPAVICGVRFHHGAERSPQHQMKLASVVSLVEYILCNWSLGSFEGPIESVDQHIWKFLGIESDKQSELLGLAEKEVEKSDVILTLNQSEDGQLRRI